MPVADEAASASANVASRPTTSSSAAERPSKLQGNFL